ncbi:MAG: Trp family transcriptional regulator [bacterium]
MPTLPPDLLAVLADLPPADLERVLVDLLTPAEVAFVSERWAIVKYLALGLSQRQVVAETGAGIATVSRGAQQLRYGTGGFALALAACGLSVRPTDAPP